MYLLICCCQTVSFTIVFFPLNGFRVVVAVAESDDRAEERRSERLRAERATQPARGDT